MNVKDLNLSSNDFTILPAWIKECHFLERLLLNECRHLREVEGIPPCIRRLEARNCVSLSLESRSLILSKELHGAPGRCNYDSEEAKPFFFCVPSRSIPKWFDHRSKGASISFWFRHSFPPALCYCLLLKPPPDVRSTFYYSYGARLFVNKEPASYRPLHLYYGALYLNDDHLIVYNFKEDDNILNFERERLGLEDRWYHAQVCVESYTYDAARTIEESGMYVIKQLYDMQHITFTNPYHQTLDSTWGDQDVSDDEDDDRIRENSDDDENDEITEILDDEDDGVVDTNSNNNNNEQGGTRMMKEKELALDKKRMLEGDDNFASSSTALICAKMARNSPINCLYDYNAITTQVPFGEACEIINNNQVDMASGMDKGMELEVPRPILWGSSSRGGGSGRGQREGRATVPFQPISPQQPQELALPQPPQTIPQETTAPDMPDLGEGDISIDDYDANEDFEIPIWIRDMKQFFDEEEAGEQNNLRGSSSQSTGFKVQVQDEQGNVSTRRLDVAGLNEGTDQPIDNGGYQLNRFLNDLGSNWMRFPLHFRTWRNVLKGLKDLAWKKVVQKLSQRNMRCRGQQTIHHTAGSKTFAVTYSELERKTHQENRQTDYGELFAITHRHCDETPTSQQQSQAELRETQDEELQGSMDPTAPLKAGLGQAEHPGRVQGMGIGIRRSMVYGRSVASEASSSREQMSGVRRLRAESVEKLRSDLARTQAVVA